MKNIIKILAITTFITFSSTSQAFAPLLALPAFLKMMATGTGAVVAHSSGGVILTSSSGYVAGTLIPASMVTATKVATAGAVTATAKSMAKPK